MGARPDRNLGKLKASQATKEVAAVSSNVIPFPIRKQSPRPEPVAPTPREAMWGKALRRKCWPLPPHPRDAA